MQAVKKICVVGAGVMGHQIALCAAMAGYEAFCMDKDTAMLDKARKLVEDYLAGRVKKGRMEEEFAGQALARITFTSSLEEGAREADLVIESITEDLELKRQLFAELDRLTPPHAILVTNTSNFVSSKIASATSRPDKVCNLHFFNPPLVVKVVEVVKGPHVSEHTINQVMEISKSMDKIPILIKKEIEGFVVNRIMDAMMDEAAHLYDLGVASYEDIDLAIRHALGQPLGPFRLMDIIGIDLLYRARMNRYRETGNPAYKPSPAVVEKFVRGEWGRKTGKGFYEYQPGNNNGQP
ncbi:3-hydroxyacyl-CoA dehydrogenase family protein [Moorella sulfitireducens]|uniref:3-hydroxyacyl-CoA dehydrogenase family protein n=1 Tax=Neomoorella sulfitireducens TaxID=2972948 RepID=UPI0021AC2590|nr:3-hydroxyacyl-CoA dehydrogenase family protein [Moorella sulfitireducens]